MKVKVVKEIYHNKHLHKPGQIINENAQWCKQAIDRGYCVIVKTPIINRSPIKPKPKPPQNINYRTLADLNTDVKKLISKLPPDIDLIVGIPRAGMIPATLIAMYWNLPLTDVKSFCRRELYSAHNAGHSLPGGSFDFNKCRKALVVDDSIYYGRNLRQVKEEIKKAKLDLEIVYACVYALKDNAYMVDYHAEVVPGPRLFEWNIAERALVSSWCIDIDGVLCRDPTKEEQRDRDRYIEFLKTTTPLLRLKPAGALVTGRLEEFRAETEEWLAKNKIKYKTLYMLPQRGDHGKFKQEIFHDLKYNVFLESRKDQAQTIAQTGKQVIVPNVGLIQKVDKLKILLHVMPMTLPGGASISCCEIAGELSKRGHNVKITGRPEKAPWQPQEIKNLMSSQAVEKLYEWADIILIHWNESKRAGDLIKKIPRPCVFSICDQGYVEYARIENASLIIFNSHWIQKDSNYSGEQMVVHPIVYPEKFRTTRGDKITLVSPLVIKGIDIFLQIAARMPNHQFLIAQGRSKKLPQDVPNNVELMPHCAHPKDIYAKARLILMPSRNDIPSIRQGLIWQEGYGRVAIEAACSGIPTIGSRESKGLQECLGEGGMFASQDDVDEWIELILRLDNPDFYQEKSEYALKLAEERHPDAYINELERRLYDICNRT